MVITQLLPTTKKRTKVYIDEELYGALYPREMKMFHITVDGEISKEDKKQMDEILLKRGKSRALYLLQRSDKTEYELRQKLKQSFYNEEIINQIIQYVVSYGYINDERYISQFVQYKASKKSFKEIQMKLAAKGIAKEDTKELLSQVREREADSIRTILKSRIKGTTILDQKELYKQYCYFMRRGFSSEEIKKALEEVKEDRDFFS